MLGLQWEQERAAFSFFSWAGSVLSQKHAWSSDVRLHEESGKIKCSKMKLLRFHLLSCWMMWYFCWVSALERQDFPSLQYCSPRGNAIGGVLPGLHALLFMSQVWQQGVTQTSSLELFKEQGESLQSKAAHTLGFPEASSQCQQMDTLHNSLAGWLVDVSLVTEHPFSATVSREGRQETVTSWICPWVYLHIFKTSPWLQTETKRNQSESMYYCFNNTFACEMFFGGYVITDACFKVIYHALHIAVYSWISFVRKSISGSRIDTNTWLIFFSSFIN